MTENLAPAMDMTESISEGIRESAMLVTLNISVWSSQKTDKDAMATLKEATHARGDAGKVVKNLLANADREYKQAVSAYNAARHQTHYKLTVPWASGENRMKGPGLLPNVLFDEYIRKMAAHKAAAERELEKFLRKYEQCVEDAKLSLGEMAKDTDYPTKEQIRAAFDMRFDFMPVPSGQDFRGLPPGVLDHLDKLVSKRIDGQVQRGVDVAVQRVREVVSHLAERLGDKDAKFKASTIENAKDMARLIGAFNVTGNPRITVIQKELQQLTQGLSAESLRSNETERESVAAEANDILKRMEAAGL